jgi:hypothetical protein
MTRVGTSFVLLAVVVFLGLPPTASAGDKEEVAAAAAKWAEAFSADTPDRILALYDREAVLWGTLSPKRRDDMSFFFGAILLLAIAGDIRMLARGGISGRRRITRHLWRMCYGLFIATGSFFLGQQQVFPAFLRGSMFLTVPALLPLPLLIYWFLRVRFSKAYKNQLSPNPVPVTP